MDKKRIGILCLGNSNWIGGYYYTINIIKALSFDQTFKVFVFFNEKKVIDEFKGFNLNNIEFINFQSRSIKNIIFKILGFSIGQELRIKNLLKKYELDLIYPFSFKQLLGSVNHKIAAWMFDLQHLEYPQYFSKEEIENRNDFLKKIIENKIKLVFSSQFMKKKFEFYYSYSNTYVLNFNPFINIVVNEKEQTNILSKYNVSKHKYFIVSNQFWQHKNYETLFKALKLYFEDFDTKKFKVIITGSKVDFRNRNYFDKLNNQFPEIFNSSFVKVLGLIDRRDQLILMKNSRFLIQPSLYEGWNSSIEEAKCLGTNVIASDIGVHREQLANNGSSIFFSKESSTELFNVLKNSENLTSILENNFNKDYLVNQTKYVFIELINNKLEKVIISS